MCETNEYIKEETTNLESPNNENKPTAHTWKLKQMRNKLKHSTKIFHLGEIDRFTDTEGVESGGKFKYGSKLKLMAQLILIFTYINVNFT